MRHAPRRKSRRCPTASPSSRVRPVLEALEDRITPSTGMYLHPDPALTPQIASPAPGQDSNTTVTIDAAGHVAVFWQDSLRGASSPVIHGEVNGSPVFTVTTAGTIDAAASDTSGDVAIVWHTDTDPTEYFLNIYDAAATAVAGPIFLGSAYDGGTPAQAHVAGDANGHFMVVCPSQFVSTGMAGEVFDLSGNALASPVALQIGVDAVAADQYGGFVVAGVYGLGGEIMGQPFNTVGNAIGAPFAIWNSSGSAVSPLDGVLALASDGAGNFVAIWSLYTNVANPLTVSPTFEGIRGQRFTDTGALQGGVFTVNNTPYPAGGTDDIVPDVALDGAGNVEVVFGATNGSAYAERFNAAGHSVGALVQLNNGGGPATVAGDPNGDVVFGWTQNGNATAQVETGSNTDRSPVALTPIAATDEVAYVGAQYTETQSYFTDPDGDALTYTATLTNGSPLPSWLSINSSGRLTGTPDASLADTTYQIKVTATDPYWNSASLVLSLTVEAVGEPNGIAFSVGPSGALAYGPAVAVNAAGDSLVVWGSSDYGLQGQVYNAQHQAVGSTIQISASQVAASVIAEPSGNFMVAGYGGGIYLEQISDTGSVIGSPAVVVGAVPAGALPQLALDAAGGIVLCWIGESGGPSSVEQVFLQRFDLNGNPLGNPVEVSASGNEPALAASPSGNIMVVWDAFNQSIGSHSVVTDSDDQVMTQLFDAQLNALTSPTPVGVPSTWAGTANGTPAIAADGLGNFDVAWDTGGVNGIGDVIDIERFDDAGNPIESLFGVTGTAPVLGGNSGPSGQRMSVLAADGSGNFTVVWSQAGNGPAGVFGERYSAQGQPVGGAFGIDTTDSTAGTPAIAADPAGDLFTAWYTLTGFNAETPTAQWYWPTATVHVPAAQSVSVGGTLVFSTPHVNAITLTGGDPTLVETLTLQANSAGPTLTMTQTAGLASITGNGTSSVTMTGTSAALNAALQGLTVQSWTPMPNLALQVTLAPNSTISVTGSVPINVHSAPPQIVTPVAAADETAYANVMYNESQNYFTDAAGNPLTYTATLANGSSLPAWLNVETSTGRLWGIPDPSDVGTTYQVRVTATDPEGQSALFTLPLTVAPDPTQPNGSEFTVGPVTVGDSAGTSNLWTSVPGVAVNAAGDAMIVASMNLDNGGEVIMGQVYNAQHQPVGPVFQVNSTVGGTGTLPTVTADAAGDFDVTWQAGTATYLQRFSPLGVAVGSAVPLAAEQGLAVVADAAGDLVLLWTGADGGIYMRRFDTQGNKLSPTVEIAGSGSGYQAAASPSGNVMVVWDTNQHAYMRMFTAQLNPLGAAAPIGGTGVAAVAVAADGLGNFDVALIDGVTTLEFERFNNVGQPLTNAQGGTGPSVIGTWPSTLSSFDPQVVAAGNGSFTIIWYSNFPSPTQGGNAFGQRYDPTGRPVGGAFLVTIGGGSPSIAADPAGDLLVADTQDKNITREIEWGAQWYWPTATVHVPTAQSTTVNTALVFSTANHNAITLTGGSPTQAETLTLTTGSAATLIVTSTTGLASITGNNTATVKLTGTSAVLNAALQGLTFHPVVSALNLTLQATLAPNADMTVSGSVAIAVKATAPPPVVPTAKVTLPTGPLSVAAGGMLVFATTAGDGITLADAGAGTSSETLTLSVSSGTLQLTTTAGLTVQGNGTSLLRVTGTLSALAAALNGLTYTAAHGASGSAVFNVYLVDSADAMGWASVTLDITPPVAPG